MTPVESELPAHLAKFDAEQWVIDEVPDHVPPADAPLHRGVAAYRRWLDARREWCAANGTSVLQLLRAEQAEVRRRADRRPR